MIIIQWKVSFMIYYYYYYLNNLVVFLGSMSHLELSDTDSDSDVLLDVRKAKLNQNSMSNKLLNVSRYKKNKRVNAWIAKKCYSKFLTINRSSEHQ